AALERAPLKVLFQFGRTKQNSEPTIHKYGAGSGSDRAIVELPIALQIRTCVYLGSSGRYRSRFRICAAFVELYCRVHTKPNKCHAAPAEGNSRVKPYLVQIIC